ncbi:MAG TPA: glycerophosphodiester phosphodiesterase family protein [Mycobacteriales bacterium]|jgi:glycerophosphoryl diester phosphodiesterase|nr:glycerophosphodiester phosphodiesterase family protein [Mycobacteriales bacterium]
MTRLPVARTTAVALAFGTTLAVGAPALLAGGPARAAAPAAAAAAAKAPALSPLVFGHRGASGYRPEHTLASYDLAVRMGADVIEPDLVSTKDHVLVVRHENEIGTTTDVADHPEFADRRVTKVVDDVEITGWFTEDFTLAELRTLRAVERLPDVRQENTIYNGRYQVPTLQEVLQLAAKASRTTGRTIGVAPETKHPTYFDAAGLSLEEPLLAALTAAGLNRPGASVYVQSFEEANLRDLRRLGLRTPVVQLTGAGTTSRPYDHVASGDPQTYAQMTTFAGLRDVATYATVLGPDKTQVVPRDAGGASLPATRLVSDAHRAGLLVVPYTYRAENAFLPLEHRSSTDATAFGDLFGELQDAFAAGVDGVFSDHPDIAFAAREDLYGFPAGVNHPQAAVTQPEDAKLAGTARALTAS